MDFCVDKLTSKLRELALVNNFDRNANLLSVLWSNKENEARYQGCMSSHRHAEPQFEITQIEPVHPRLFYPLHGLSAITLFYPLQGRSPPHWRQNTASRWATLAGWFLRRLFGRVRGTRPLYPQPGMCSYQPGARFKRGKLQDFTMTERFANPCFCLPLAIMLKHRLSRPCKSQFAFPANSRVNWRTKIQGGT